MRRISKTGSILAGLLIMFLWVGSVFAQAEALTSLTLELALNQAQEHGNQVNLAELALQEARLTYEEAMANQLVRPSPIALQQAENAWFMAQRNRELAGIDLSMQVEQTYYDVLRAKMTQDLAERSLEQAKAQLGSTTARYEEGMLSEVDLLASEMQVASAEAEFNRTKAAQASARMRLNRVLGLDLTTSVELVDEFIYEPVQIDLEAAMAEAKKSRVDLRQAINTLELRRKELAINDNQYTPSLTKQKSQVSLEKAEIEYAEKELDVIMEVRQNYTSLKEAEQRIPIQQSNVERAKESLRITQVRYEAGVITAVEVIEAQKGLFQAESQLIQAVFEYNTSLAKFYRSIGGSDDRR